MCKVCDINIYHETMEFYKDLIRQNKIRIKPEEGIIEYDTIRGTVVKKWDNSKKCIIIHLSNKSNVYTISAKNLVWLYVYGNVPYDKRVYSINFNQNDFRVQNLKLMKRKFSKKIKEQINNINTNVQIKVNTENNNESNNEDKNNNKFPIIENDTNENFDTNKEENIEKLNYEKQIKELAEKINNIICEYKIDKKDILFDILLEM